MSLLSLSLVITNLHLYGQQYGEPIGLPFFIRGKCIVDSVLNQFIHPTQNVTVIVGGTASVYVGQPLDTVKVKMQTFPTIYKNAAKCFFQTYKQDGIVRGLYAGNI